MNSNSHLLVPLHLLTEKLIFLILSVLLMNELFCSFVVLVITFSRILRQNGMKWSQNDYNLTYLVGILIILYIFIDI